MESDVRLQPNSASIGLMNTPKLARSPPAVIMITTRTPSTTQA